MKRFFTPAFFRFLLAFSAILIIAFLILSYAQDRKEAAVAACASLCYYPA